MPTSTGTTQPKSARTGPKAKSTALQPRSVSSLDLPSYSTTLGEEDEVENRNPRHTRPRRKSYTREFKLKALSMLQGYRTDLKTGKKVQAGMICK